MAAVGRRPGLPHNHPMKRRRLLAVLMTTPLVLCEPARGQSAKRPLIGILSSGSAAAERKRFDDFLSGLRELGYVEGRNLDIERRYADGRFDALPALARELVARRVDVIMCMSTIAAKAASQATDRVPIVFATAADPVEEGLVRSLARPGANATGLSTTGIELGAKGLELLVGAFPAVRRVLVLTAPRTAHASAQLAELQRVCASLGLALDQTVVHRPDDLAPARSRVRESRIDALYVMQGAQNSAARPLIVRFAAETRLPAVYPQRNYVDAGGLMSYGPSYDENYRRAASYVDRILKGARPGDLPVEQPSRFEFVVNLATAKAQGLEIAPSILVRATDVIR